MGSLRTKRRSHSGSEHTISFNPSNIPARRMLLLAADRAARLSSYATTVKTLKLSSLPAHASARALVRRALVRRARALAASGRAATTLTGPAKPAAQHGGANQVMRASKLPAAQRGGANQVVHVYCALSVTAPRR